MFKYVIIILFWISIEFYTQISKAEDIPATECKPLTSINSFQLNDSPQLIKSQIKDKEITEEINDGELILKVTTNSTSTIEYYHFKHNKLYQYVLKIENPSLNVLESYFNASKQICGEAKIIIDDSYTEFKKENKNGFYMSIDMSQPPLNPLLIIIYGFKNSQLKDI